MLTKETQHEVNLMIFFIEVRSELGLAVGVQGPMTVARHVVEGEPLIAGENVARTPPPTTVASSCWHCRFCYCAKTVIPIRACAQVAKPWWSQCCDERSSAPRRARAGPWIWTVVAIAFCLLETLLLVEFSNVQKRFSSALHRRAEAEFWVGIRDFIVVIAIAAPLFVTSSYLQSALTLNWRYWLTARFMRRYLAQGSRPFFELKAAKVTAAVDDDAANDAEDELDNPDQRITSSVNSFTGTTTGLTFLVIGKLANLAAFTVVLWSIAPKLVIFLLLYTTLGSAVALRLFGAALARLTRGVLLREANFRFALIRVRELAEPVAFYGGEAYELRSASATLGSLYATLLAQLRWSTGAQLFSFVLDYITILAPYIFLAPLYFADETFDFGTFAQASYSFSIVRSALTVLIANMADFATLGAQATRLAELDEAIDAVQAEHEASGTHGVRAGGITAVGGGRIARSSGNGGGAAAAAVVVSGGSDGAVLRVEALSLWTPGGEVQLCDNASFAVAAGQSVLIRGRSGCGKTSLLRAIGGLWRRGTGSIVLPATERVAFLPQQPYMALGGSLREQLIFPRHDGGEDAEGRTVGALTSSAMWRALQEVGLAQVATRLLGGNSDRGVTEDPALLQARCLDVVTRWSDTLSRGEQQRLAVARLIVGAISKSEVADGRAARGLGNASDAGLALVLLDEATAACDAETERALYLAMRRWLPRVAIVSIGHNETLVAFHSHHLVFEEGKDKVPTWSLIEAEGAEFT